MSRRARSISITLLTLASLAAVSCFEPLTIEISNEKQLSFILHGAENGYLGGLSVREYSSAGPGAYVWTIDSKGKNIPMSYFHLTTIRYGEVPTEWVQETPSDGSKPSPLLEGKTYQIHCAMFDVESRAAVFTIRNGKPVPVH